MLHPIYPRNTVCFMYTIINTEQMLHPIYPRNTVCFMYTIVNTEQMLHSIYPRNTVCFMYTLVNTPHKVYNKDNNNNNNNNLSRHSYMFRPVRSRHLGSISRCTQLQEIMSKMCICGVRIKYFHLKLLLTNKIYNFMFNFPTKCTCTIGYSYC
jgi:hypothetical protein